MVLDQQDIRKTIARYVQGVQIGPAMFKDVGNMARRAADVTATEVAHSTAACVASTAEIDGEI